jgi:DNA (cytosine-5)-methyltransferase 1
MGYRVAASLWTAQEVGAPHRRERIFIVGARMADT